MNGFVQRWLPTRFYGRIEFRAFGSNPSTSVTRKVTVPRGNWRTPQVMEPAVLAV